ncbi:MAG: hypothetical protein K0R38_2672 [Polyangiaceae bacterium]|jgi:hypothetical protein|nr:hypothetical protein [Polyangiaceae bacterium]
MVTAEIQQLIQNYARAFESCEPEKVLAFYDVPTTGISAHSVDLYPTRATLLAQFTSVTRAFRELRLTRCAAELRALTIHGPNLAELTVRWSLYGPDEVPLKMLLNTYVLRRCSGELKIAAVILLDG